MNNDEAFSVIKEVFEKAIDSYGFNANVEITKHLTAEIMVINYKKNMIRTVAINTNYQSNKLCQDWGLGQMIGNCRQKL